MLRFVVFVRELPKNMRTKHYFLFDFKQYLVFVAASYYLLATRTKYLTRFAFLNNKHKVQMLFSICRVFFHHFTFRFILLIKNTEKMS